MAPPHLNRFEGTKKMTNVCVLRTAVTDYGEQFLTIGEQNDGGSVIVGSVDQARQLIEALNAGINKIWSEEK